MKEEKLKLVVNEVIVNKLESISFDIKYYLNINASIILDESSISFNLMDDDEVNELIEIRKRLKILSHKLKNKLK